MLLALPLLLASRAFAGSVAAEIPSTPALEPGLVVLVRDAGERFPAGAVPSGTVEDGGSLRAFALRDDGRAPDAAAGDRVFSAVIPLARRGGLARFTLLDATGGVLWADDLPIGMLDHPTLRVHLEAGREAVLVETNDVFVPEPEEPVVEPGSRGSRESEERPVDEVLPELVGWSGVPYALPDLSLGPVLIDNKRVRRRSDGGREQVSSLLPPVLKGPMLLGVVLLLSAGVVLVARRPPALDAMGRSVSGPGRRERRPGTLSDAELVSLLRERVAAGPVLLLPAPVRLAVLDAESLPHVVRLRTLQPDTPEVRRAAESLRPLGRVTVVVDGPGALLEPREGESGDAVLEELLAALPPEVDAVAVLG